MNYPEIKEKYPLVWNEFISWAHSNHFGYHSITHHTEDNIFKGELNHRDLYDFFDYNGIIVNITFDTVAYSYEVDNVNYAYPRHPYTNDTISTRKECEIEAFTNGFKSFEEWLQYRNQKDEVVLTP